MAISKEDIIKLPKLQKAAVLLGIIVVIFGAYYLFYYSGATSELDRLERRVKKLRGEIKKKKVIAADLAAYKERVRRIKIQWKLAREKLPKEKEIPDLLTNITEKGKRAGLTFTLFKQLPNKRQNIYTEIPVSIGVLGSYHSVATFFYEVSKIDRIIQFSDLKMSHYQMGTGQLKSSFKATTYVESKPLPKKKKKRKRRKRRR